VWRAFLTALVEPAVEVFRPAGEFPVYEIVPSFAIVLSEYQLPALACHWSFSEMTQSDARAIRLYASRHALSEHSKNSDHLCPSPLIQNDHEPLV
jgi:hypothetical protein